MPDVSTQREETTELRAIFSENFTFSKRLLGIVLLSGGIVGSMAILAVDFIGGGREGGIGPSQSFALMIVIAAAIIGATLIPLGKRPA